MPLTFEFTTVTFSIMYFSLPVQPQVSWTYLITLDLLFHHTHEISHGPDARRGFLISSWTLILHERPVLYFRVFQKNCFYEREGESLLCRCCC